MVISLPQPFEVAHEWTWDNYAPHFQALADTHINTQNVDQWLDDWSALYSTFAETATWLHNLSNLDTNNQEADTNFQVFMQDIYPPVQKAQFELQTKLLESGLTPVGLDITLKQMRALNDIFCEDNLSLQVKETEVSRKYGRIYGSQSVEWGGEEKTLIAMQHFNAYPDRALRKKAWWAVAKRRLQDRETINNIWVELMDIRKQLYENVGYDNFRQYAWKAHQRIDYTPEDVMAFCEAIEQVVVPVMAKMREERRLQLNVESLRPWDTIMEPHDMAPDSNDRPSGQVYANGQELVEKSAAIFNQIDPELGSFFQTMRDKSWLSLNNTKGKRPGAYCASLPVSKGAFLFGNATGQTPDISMVLHEAGHAFHAFYTGDEPLIGTPKYPLEFAEVASMSMELLALPYLTEDKGGFFKDEKQLAHYVVNQLEGQLHSWSYQAVVILFQHWAYTHHDQASSPAECDKTWTDLWLRFSPSINYTGLEDWLATGWHRKQHIFGLPFYYIEYGLAQLGATQIWANALNDQPGALEAYRAGLKLGNRVSLPQLYNAAGAKLAFDSATLQQAVDLIVEQMEHWQARLA